MQKLEALYRRKRPLRHHATLGKLTEDLGPDPRASLAAMVDLGLDDAEIGRYYRIDPDAIGRLRHAFNVVQARPAS